MHALRYVSIDLSKLNKFRYFFLANFNSLHHHLIFSVTFDFLPSSTVSLLKILVKRR